MTTTAPLPPLTASDFEMQYDPDHRYPFFEDEDAAIFAFGHPDPAELAEAINAYFVHCGASDPEGDPACTPDDVDHRWAVTTQRGDETGFRYRDITADGRHRDITEDTPGAFPITVVIL